MTTVAPRVSTACRSRPRTSAAVPVSRAPVGSSANTTSGSVTRARAMATRCCWPPDSSPGRRLALSARPTRASIASARRRSWRCPASRIGSSTFCSTVSEGSRLKAWKTKPRRLRRSSVSWFSRIPVISVPPRRTEPADGRSRPAAHWRKVDLPEPDGPMTAVNVPWGRARSMPARGVYDPGAAAVLPPDSPQLDGETGGALVLRPLVRFPPLPAQPHGPSSHDLSQPMPRRYGPRTVRNMVVAGGCGVGVIPRGRRGGKGPRLVVRLGRAGRSAGGSPRVPRRRVRRGLRG